MKANELKDSWKNQDVDLQSMLNLNMNLLTEVKTDKAKAELKSLLKRRIWEAVIFMALMIALFGFAAANYPTIQYLLAAGVLVVFATVGFVGSILEMKLIMELDYSLPITVFQEKLQKIKAHSLQVLKLLFLTFPFYFAYIVIGFKVILNIDIVAEGDPTWLWSNVILSVVFVPFIIWFNSKLKLTSKKKWVRALIIHNGGKQVESAINFMGEIASFKEEH